jgi:hypothetical protein
MKSLVPQLIQCFRLRTDGVVFTFSFNENNSCELSTIDFFEKLYPKNKIQVK